MLPASGGRTALYFDILMKDVEKVEVQEAKQHAMPSSPFTPYTVVVALVQDSNGEPKTNVHRNGLGLQAQYVGITFQDLETAEDVRDHIGTRISTKRTLRGSIAEEVLDVSQPHEGVSYNDVQGIRSHTTLLHKDIYDIEDTSEGPEPPTKKRPPARRKKAKKPSKSKPQPVRKAAVDRSKSKVSKDETSGFELNVSEVEISSFGQPVTIDETDTQPLATNVLEEISTNTKYDNLQNQVPTTPQLAGQELARIAETSSILGKRKEIDSIASKLSLALSDLIQENDQKSPSKPRRSFIKTTKQKPSHVDTGVALSEPLSHVEPIHPRLRPTKTPLSIPQPTMKTTTKPVPKLQGLIWKGVGNEELGETKLPNDHMLRKPFIIGFDQKGPRNQGKLTVGDSAANPLAIEANIPTVASPEVPNQGAGGLSPLPQTPQAVSHPRSSATPPPQPPITSVEENFEPWPERRQLSRIPSSQVIIDDNGSPRQVSPGQNSGVDAAQLVDELEDEDDPVQPVHSGMPVDRHTPDNGSRHSMLAYYASSISPIMLRKEPILLSNRKHVPSSPHEPSQMMSDMTRHRPQPEGSYMNLDTVSEIRPSELPDPFSIGKGSIPRSLKRVRYALPDEDDENETPESLESDSSTTQSSNQSAELREQEWLEALRPDQGRTLQSLYELSNVISPLSSFFQPSANIFSQRLCRHLNDKESALDDVVADFKSTGERLIDKFEEAHEAKHNDFIARAGGVKTSLLKAIDSASETLGMGMRRVRKRRLGRIEGDLGKEMETVDGLMAKLRESYDEACE